MDKDLAMAEYLDNFLARFSNGIQVFNFTMEFGNSIKKK